MKLSDAKSAIAFAGKKTYISKKGKPYADIYGFILSENGVPDLEQVKFRTFSPEVISQCETLKPGQQIIIDLEVADIYGFILSENGVPDLEQVKFRTFSPEVISQCETLKPGQQIIIDLEVREAFVTGVELYEED